jgi:peroxiredoxin
MRTLAALFVAAFLARVALADLESIERQFERKLDEARKTVLAEKLAALEAYVAAEANAKNEDHARALFEAARLAGELERHDAALRHARALLARPDEGGEGARVRVMAGVAALRSGKDAKEAEGLLLAAIGMGELTRESVATTMEAADALAEHHLDSGNAEGAAKAWTAVRETLQHPQIAEFVDGKLREIALVGTEPAAFRVKDLQGKDLDLGQYAGKVVLVDFWATWCPPCVEELPNVVAAYREFRDRGFEVVGISLDRDRAALDAFLASHATGWRQHHDASGEIAERYAVQSIPATFLIGRDGKIARTNLRGEALHKAVARLLAKT